MLDRAIGSYLASRSDTPAILKQAMSEGQDAVMATCMMGYLTRLAGDRRNARRSETLHRNLSARAAAGEGSTWERAHVTALGLWLADDLHALMAHFETILETWPSDVLTLRMLHYLYFYDGDIGRMRASVAQALPHFDGHPLEGYVKGMLAFALEEAGDYEPAERFGREAVETNPQDVWAAHAVAHVLEMQGRSDEGIGWIDGLRRQWHDTNNFRFHLFWHQALYHLRQGAADAALALYDDELAAALEDDFYLDLCNAASLLLRLETCGVNVGERWQPLAAIAEQHVADTELVFASLHYLMPLVRTDHPAAGRLLDTLQAWGRRDTTQGQVVRAVALDVAAFLVAVHDNDSAAALTRFDAFRTNLHRIGGSRAQRQLFDVLKPPSSGAIH